MCVFSASLLNVGDAFLFYWLKRKDDFMKKTISVLLALMIMCAQFFVSADAEYLSQGLKETQKKYADLISTAIEKSEYEEEQIDKEHIFIVEHTSPMQMCKIEEAIWIYVALPILNSTDIAYAHFDENEYVSEITNFAALKGIENPYGNKLQNYINNNYLSEPTKIKNMWISERVHLFAYNVICNNKEYIIPYYFTDESTFNITNNEECSIELGKAYILDDFLNICEKEAELFAEQRKNEREQEKEENSYTYVDNQGETVTTKPEKHKKGTEEEVTKSGNTKKEEKKLSGGHPSNVLTFEELTGFSNEDIDHIVIRNGVDGIGYSTSYKKVISAIYDTINTKTFNVDMNEDIRGGFGYQILFFDKNNSTHTYTIPHGITKNGITYTTTNEENLENVVANAYNLIANNCSNWSNDYIVQAKDLGFLEDISDILYKEPVTREKFCEIVYNMLMKTVDDGFTVPQTFYFTDTYNAKVSTLYYADIIKGKSERIFAPNDYLTREEAATILYRVAQFMKIDTPQSSYNESVEYYIDKDIISDWAFNPIYYMKEMGIMIGISESLFSPKDTYTTEQAITTIVKLYDKHQTK